MTVNPCRSLSGEKMKLSTSCAFMTSSYGTIEQTKFGRVNPCPRRFDTDRWFSSLRSLRRAASITPASKGGPSKLRMSCGWYGTGGNHAA